jgi:hypothetical protein
MQHDAQLAMLLGALSDTEWPMPRRGLSWRTELKAVEAVELR